MSVNLPEANWVPQPPKAAEDGAVSPKLVWKMRDTETITGEYSWQGAENELVISLSKPTTPASEFAGKDSEHIKPGTMKVRVEQSWHSERNDMTAQERLKMLDGLYARAAHFVTMYEKEGHRQEETP